MNRRHHIRIKSKKEKTSSIWRGAIRLWLGRKEEERTRKNSSTYLFVGRKEPTDVCDWLVLTRRGDSLHNWLILKPSSSWIRMKLNRQPDQLYFVLTPRSLSCTIQFFPAPFRRFFFLSGWSMKEVAGGLAGSLDSVKKFHAAAPSDQQMMTMMRQELFGERKRWWEWMNGKNAANVLSQEIQSTRSGDEGRKKKCPRRRRREVEEEEGGGGGGGGLHHHHPLSYSQNFLVKE